MLTRKAAFALVATAVALAVCAVLAVVVLTLKRPVPVQLQVVPVGHDQTRGLGVTAENFLIRFNDGAESMTVKRIENVHTQEGELRGTIGDSAVITFDLDGKWLTSVLVIAQPKDPLDRMKSVLAMTLAMNIIEPEITADERKDLFTKLGVFVPTPNLEERAVRRGPRVYKYGRSPMGTHFYIT